jgi:hypothetical protein
MVDDQREKKQKANESSAEDPYTYCLNCRLEYLVSRITDLSIRNRNSILVIVIGSTYILRDKK